MVDTIYSAIEFYGKGDPYFGGTAADWALYKTEDGRHAFISAAEAQRCKLVMAYFPTAAEAEKAGAAARTRKGSISAVPIKPRLEVPTAQISWIVGNKHVGEEDGELAEDFADRPKRRARPIRT
ncbi:hypothetical protein KGO5_05288 [Sinorhizobium sp. KGO-5]|uniref:hypothetical protein n=1 Tax=Sinorhizobium TaxID=28105 RepID=UPI001F16E5E3|nr:hypothetical protein [Sinorhizobium meliloti]GCA52822.1 hypothetical protein KGO5_05288 [Sinorhizobium sp. KGO-5]